MLTQYAKVFLLSKEGDAMGLSWSHLLRVKRELYSERRDHFLRFIKHPESLTELTIDPLADDPKVSRNLNAKILSYKPLIRSSRRGIPSAKMKLSGQKSCKTYRDFRMKQIIMKITCST
jgi:hypothetical protein